MAKVKLECTLLILFVTKIGGNCDTPKFGCFINDLAYQELETGDFNFDSKKYAWQQQQWHELF
jgi:hypothetical protein